MNMEEVKQLAWVGYELVQGPIRGVVVTLHGLNVTGMKSEPWPEDHEYAAAGLLSVYPYYGPWCWMNRQARAFVGELVDSIYRQYAIPADAPLVAVGDSMGGLSVLLMTRYALRRPVTRCCAIYPVCDLPFHYTERPDVPRTIRMAYWGYEEDFDEVLIEHSPLHQVTRLPRVPYLFLHGDLDKAVNKQKHSDRMVAAMQQHGFDVVYHGIPGYGHGGPMPPAMVDAKMKFVIAGC